MFNQVKIFDSKGNLKKILSSEELSRKHDEKLEWKRNVTLHFPSKKTKKDVVKND